MTTSDKCAGCNGSILATYKRINFKRYCSKTCAVKSGAEKPPRHIQRSMRIGPKPQGKNKIPKRKEEGIHGAI